MLHSDLLNASGDLELPVGGFLVRTGRRVILVDAGLGPVQRDGYRSGALLESLATLSVTTDAITDVVLTHLHFDHVGWVTQRQKIVFPNAVYRCHQRDWDHFVSAPDAEPGAARKLGPLTAGWSRSPQTARSPRAWTFAQRRAIRPVRRS
jgi:glyoxylase-like metal-dependent hydrolase (beta-lactamase superfamily II)